MIWDDNALEATANDPKSTHNEKTLARALLAQREIGRAAAERLMRVLSALRNLVNRIGIVHADPRYLSVWELAQSHFGEYRGPKYVKELEIAEKAVADESCVGVDLGPFVERRPDVCGGEPVIKGTRITIKHIWQLAHVLGKSFCDIIEEYPHLDMSQVNAAIEYGKEHPELQSNGEDEE